jgi:hypothetical protein
MNPILRFVYDRKTDARYKLDDIVLDFHTGIVRAERAKITQEIFSRCTFRCLDFKEFYDNCAGIPEGKHIEKYVGKVAIPVVRFTWDLKCHCEALYFTPYIDPSLDQLAKTYLETNASFSIWEKLFDLSRSLARRREQAYFREIRKAEKLEKQAARKAKLEAQKSLEKPQ